MANWFLSIILSVVDRLSQPAASHAVEQSLRAAASTTAKRVPLEDEETSAHRGKSRSCFCLPTSWLSRFMGRVLRLGETPRHVAFILDGNRRFAVKQGLQRKSHGHAFGFDKLHEALEWCFDAGVSEVSVYAFSIDNFKRPREEVETLMRLAQDKLGYLLRRSELMRRNQVVIRVWGDVALLPEALQQLVARVADQTRDNCGPTLNVCFPYTSSHEVVAATKRLATECVAEGRNGDSVTTEEFERTLFTAGDHPQLLIRTSGEARLSDFFCWQTGEAQFQVFHCYWPEFSLFQFVWAVLAYRFHSPRQQH